MSSKIKKTNKQNDIITDNKGKLSKPARIAIIIGLVVVLLVGAIAGAYAIIKNNGKNSLLNTDVVQEYDGRYVGRINCSIHDSIDVEKLYTAWGAGDNEIIANMGNATGRIER